MKRVVVDCAVMYICGVETTKPLEGKVIVVVGGTTGLGFSAARAILAAGGKVVVVGRSQESATRAMDALGDAAAALVADATDPGTADLAIELAMMNYGGFHGLYHVAGGSGRKMGDGPLHDLTNAGWEYTIRLNLTSMMMSNRAAVRRLVKQGGGGAILNMGSVLGFSPSPRYFGTFAYAAAKSAIVGMTRSAAAYYAGQNIRFNVVAPALVETPMAQRAAEDEEVLAFIDTKQPLDGGRIGRPEDLDAAVVYLLSDQSRFVTGQVLCVDGGWCVSEGQIPKGAG